MPDITPLEAAEILEKLAEKDYESDGAYLETDENIAANFVVSLLRAIAAGEYK